MATHQLANGLASLGRHGDTMLMHVSPSEVAGLKAIGSMTGSEITTNPHTGLPEAFSFGNFFKNLAPTIVGALLAPETGGASLAAALGQTGTAANIIANAAPIVGGMATGVALGQDPLMSGLGGFGGGSLGTSFGKMGAGGGYAAGQTIPAGQAITTPQGLADLATKSPLNVAGTYNPALSSVAQTAATTAAVPTFSQGLSTMGEGVKQLTSKGGWDKFTSPEIGGSAFKLGAPLAMAGLAGAQEDLYPETKILEDKDKDKYRDPVTGRLNLSASPGLRLATGGTINTNTSTISSGGIQDLYGTNDQTTGTQQLSKDGYGIGRLENLASAGSRAKAADTFYAVGGPVAFAKGGHQGYLDGEGDGMSDSIPATIEGKQPARLADGEFVVSADVVSHLGNGSTKAGAKRLYAMMDKVRQARTGTKKQGKEINAERFLPKA